MKKLIIKFFCGLILIGLCSCSDIENLFGGKDEEPNELNGDTKIAMGEVGNIFSASLNIDGNYLDLNEDCQILSNDNGVITMDIKCDLPKIPALQNYIDQIPVEMINNGRVNAQVKFKITSEGVQDYFNKDGKPHTIVKYDCNVGDEYKLTKSDGKTITRKVTAKSDKDDFPYGFFNIKTITIEQDSRIKGIQKFILRANHKFGIVHVQAVMDDGSIIQSYVFSKN
jgi:hypothetical protein